VSMSTHLVESNECIMQIQIRRARPSLSPQTFHPPQGNSRTSSYALISNGTGTDVHYEPTNRRRFSMSMLHPSSFVGEASATPRHRSRRPNSASIAVRNQGNPLQSDYRSTFLRIFEASSGGNSSATRTPRMDGRASEQSRNDDSTEDARISSFDFGLYGAGSTPSSPPGLPIPARPRELFGRYLHRDVDEGGTPVLRGRMEAPRLGSPMMRVTE
jgi:hypothetical protein